MSEAEEKKLLNVKETAEILGVSESRVHQLIRDKRLKAEKVGRDWIICRNAITEDVLDRPTGRPPKDKAESNK